MSNRLTDLLHASDGNAGTQGDFLDECWQSASPGHLGTHGNAETEDAMRSSVPERSQIEQERNLAQTTGENGLCSCVPKECEQQQQNMNVMAFITDWAAAADQLTRQFADPAARQQLFTLFYRQAQFLRSDRGLARGAAEREAYGWLLTKILNMELELQFKQGMQ